MQTIYDFAGSTDMWSTSVDGHFMKVVNLTGFNVLVICYIFTVLAKVSFLLENIKTVCGA